MLSIFTGFLFHLVWCWESGFFTSGQFCASLPCPRGHLEMLWGHSACHSYEKRTATGIWWERSETMPSILKCTGQPPTRKNNLAQNVNSTEVEKLTHSKGSGSERVRKKRNSGTIILQRSLVSQTRKHTWKCNFKRLRPGGGGCHLWMLFKIVTYSYAEYLHECFWLEPYGCLVDSKLVIWLTNASWFEWAR